MESQGRACGSSSSPIGRISFIEGSIISDLTPFIWVEFPFARYHEELPTLREEEEFIADKLEEGGEIFLCISDQVVVGSLGVDRKPHPQ